MKAHPEDPAESDLEKMSREFENLGLNPAQFTDDADAPPVDESALVQLAQRQLPGPAVKLLLGYLQRYASWRDAYCRIAARETGAG